ncbi:MAG: Mu-like prophage major head subunit gpT family protein [Spirochaetaceae bacterium]|nr:Mu-like prophage major head subunit gpT family protein [Spirochaetaceae bacterium]
MIIKDVVLDALRTMVKGEFRTQLEFLIANDIYKTLATIISSNSKSNTYGWLGKFPQIREWVGDRVLESIKESSYTIENKKYEATLSIERTDIEDDNIGIYKPLSRSMADEVIAFFNRNLATLLKEGFSNICYDKEPFFSEEHPVYSNADGTGTAEEVSNILGDKTKKGSPWFLLSLSGSLKPFILQQRNNPELEEITDTKNDTVFLKDKYLYGVRWRGSFGYGFWQQAIASKEPLTSVNFEAARLQMRQFKRDGGDPLGIVPTHLVVSSDNEVAALQILKAQLLDNGKSNINYNTAELVVSPWL